MNATIARETVSIFLVEDQTIVRSGLRALLQLYDHVEVVGEAATLQEAIFKAKTLHPHVILLDIRLPDGSGAEGCQEILRHCPNSRVLFLTAFTDDDTILTAIRGGAQGFLVKGITPDTLVQAIETVVAGGSILDPAITDRVMKWVMETKSFAPPLQSLEVLSPQEQRVLQLMAECKTNKEIAETLQLSPKTIKNYVSHIFQKLYLTRRAQAVAFSTTISTQK